MGREIRRVPRDWQHPRDARGNYIPLFGRDAIAEIAEWDRGAAAWARGEFPEWTEEAHRKLTYAAYAGARPDPSNYMPTWTEAERTHIQMYEDTSEGTPISPVLATPEELARWLADNHASAFGSMTATFEQWLAVCRRGWAPSCALVGKSLISGAQLMAEHQK